MTGIPSARQQRAWDALHEHRSIPKAAAAIGVEPSNLREACRTYMLKVGIPGPMPYVGGYTRKQGICPQHDSTIARLQRERDDALAEAETLRALVADLQALAHPWVAVHARLERIERAVTRPVAITHRRVADGGVGGRKERRAA